MNAEEAAALIARAKREFAEMAAARRPELKALAERASWDTEALSALHREAHQLHGTGGTLGFAGISAAAQALESVTTPSHQDNGIAEAHARLDAELAKLGTQ